MKHKTIVYICLIIIVLVMLRVIYKSIRRDEQKRVSKDCILIHDAIPLEVLNSPVKSIIITTRKYIPLFYTLHMSHWSAICVTDNGLYEISSSYDLSVYLTKVTKENDGIFLECRSGFILRYVKEYPVKNNNSTIKDVVEFAAKIYTNYTPSYDLYNNNCQHFVIDIIRKFCTYDESDKLLIKHKGFKLVQQCWNDLTEN